MDLKNTINNTNTQKENIKTVATQIDNKLVELGGEQAIDLSDVANKMGAMVTGNYTKYAKIQHSKTQAIGNLDNTSKELVFEIPTSIAFLPNYVEGWMYMKEDESIKASGSFKYAKGSIVNSGGRYDISSNGNYFASVEIKSVTITNNNLKIIVRAYTNGYMGNNIEISLSGFTFLKLP